MTTVVTEKQEVVVVQDSAQQTVVLDEVGNVVVEDQQSVFVVQPSTGFLVVEKDTSTVVAAGYQGPPGPAGPTGPQGTPGLSEEDVTYSKRIDFVTDSELYRGEAQVGTGESSSTWRIRKIVLGSDGDVTETWAGGTADFNKSWNLRTTYTYS